MKKLLATSAIAAVTALSAEAKFEGAYSGIQGSYSSTSIALNSKSAGTPAGHSVKPAGFALGLNGGFGCNYNDIYVGGDAQVGFDWAKKHTVSGGNPTFTAKKDWFAGVGARVGVHATNDWLAYVYLGLAYNKYKLSYTTSSQPTYKNISKNVNSYSYVPGIGTSYMITHNMYVDLNYKYSKSFSQTRPKYYTWSKKPNSHIVTLGAGYKF